MKDRRSREWTKKRAAEVRRVLHDVVERRSPDLHLAIVDPNRKLTAEERQAVKCVLADELSGYGLVDNREPNAYGLTIEDAIDLVGTL